MIAFFRPLRIEARSMAIFGLVLWVMITTASAYEEDDCIACHGDKSGKSRLTINIDRYLTSVHAAKFSCQDCHRGVTSSFHISKAGSGAANCVDCHSKRKQHGGADAEGVRPSCQQCHTRHEIFARSNQASSLHPKNMVKTCRQCHPQESGQASYFSWLPSLRIKSHNKQNLGVDYSPDNCLGCHQGQAAHGEAQEINSDGCNKCHFTAEGKNAMLGLMHPKADPEKQVGVYMAALFYQMIIVLVLWFGFRWILRIRPKNR